MAIVCVGVDLAKNVFAIHGVDEVGKAVWVQARVPRAQLLAAFSNLRSCRIDREACSGAHHWARQLLAMGHKVRLIAPKFVTPYRLGGKRGKYDAADAAAICEAVQRPHLRFAPIKSVEQQARMAVHRMRQQQFGARHASPHPFTCGKTRPGPGFCDHFAPIVATAINAATERGKALSAAAGG